MKNFYNIGIIILLLNQSFLGMELSSREICYRKQLERHSPKHTPLIEAICSGNKEKALEIINQENCDLNDDYVLRAPHLIYATAYNQPSVVEALLEKKANINVEYGGRDALSVATEFDYIETAECLLRHGANPNNNYTIIGQRPIHLANSLAMINLLLKYNANPNAADASRFKPLHYAINEYDANHDTTKIMSSLIAHGASINELCEKNETSLTFAVKENSLPIITFLLQQKNIAIDRPNSNSESPLTIAIKKKFPETVKLLLEHGANPNGFYYNTKILQYAKEIGHEPTITILLEKGAQE
ncbi:MAG: ankyrin repeat domain-containing protein [Candidatus Babeliales bacterium]